MPRHLPPPHGDAAAEYRAAREGAALFDLSHATKIELKGPEAASFLHNLATNDIKKLAPGGGCETFLTTNKARVVGHGWVGHFALADGPALLFDTVPNQADKLIKHLDHYLISEQVELADRTESFALFRLAGPHAAGLLRDLAGTSFEDLPDQHHRPAEGLGFVRRQRLLALEGFDLFCPADQAASLWQRLVAAGARPAGSTAYELLRLEAGLPEFGVDLDENRLAMEVGRTAAAISYDKGCYLGQETIVMARDRGHANRLLLGVKVADGPPPSPGTKLYRAAVEVGEITSSVYSPRLACVAALAYLKREWQTPGLEVSVGPVGDARPGVVATLPFEGTQVAAET